MVCYSTFITKINLPCKRPNTASGNSNSVVTMASTRLGANFMSDGGKT